MYFENPDYIENKLNNLTETIIAFEQSSSLSECITLCKKSLRIYKSLYMIQEQEFSLLREHMKYNKNIEEYIEEYIDNNTREMNQALIDLIGYIEIKLRSLFNSN